MRKLSTCCNAEVHHQNDTDYCTSCIRILDKSGTRYTCKKLISILTTIFFLYMVFSVSFANAPVKLNWCIPLKSEAKPVKYAVDYMQIKIIEGNNSNAVSVAGATGNMQIMPVSLDDWNAQHPNEQYTMDDMKDEAKNVRVGKWMLQTRIPQILSSAGVPLTINNILVAYNWGCGKVIDWYKAGAVIARLPDESQQYICKYWAKAKI